MVYKYNPFTGNFDRVGLTEISPDVLTQIDADTGSAVPAVNIINLIGTAAQGISTSASGNTVTLTISNASTTQKGVIELATDAESIAGSSTTLGIVPSSLQAKLGAQTANSLPYATGAANAIQWTAALTDGQILIGATSAVPALGTITSTDASITVSNGANTIDLSVASASINQIDTDSGSATPTAGVIQIAGGNQMNTSGATNVVTINLDTDVTVSVLRTPIITSATSLTITATGGAINIGNDAVAFDVNICTGAAVRGFLAGSTTGASSSTVRCGTGGVTLGNGAVSHNTFIGSAVGTGLTQIGSGSNGMTLLTGTAGNITLAPDTTGRVRISYASPTAIAVYGTSGALEEVGPLTDGQLIIGSTSSTPVAATLTAGTGITIANAAGAVTVSASGSGLSWNDVAGSPQTLAVSNGYVTNNAGGVTYVLPASASLGDVIQVVGKLGAWTITQNANQQILVGSASSTVGVGGSVASTNVGDCIEIVCITAGASTVWRATATMGNLTVV